MKLKPKKLMACVCTSAALLMVSSSADALLASIKAFGMAGTATAYPMDSFSGVFNPAGIVDVEDRIDVEGAWDQTLQSATVENNAFPVASIRNSTNGFHDGAKTQNAYLANFGVNKHLWCAPCDMTIGLSVYNRNFLKTTYGSPIGILGGAVGVLGQTAVPTKPGMEYVHETVAPMWSMRILKDHSLGVALNLNFQRFKINGIQIFDGKGGTFTTHPGFVTNNGYNWSSGVGFTVGWMSRFWCDRIKLGVAYTPRCQMSKFKRYRGFFVNGGQFNLPQRWNAGISFRWIPKSVIAFDMEWVDWEQIKSLSNPIQTNTADFIENKLGSSTGTGFGWKRQIFYRVGIDYTFDCFNWGCTKLWDSLTVRTGFRHVNVPFPNSQAGTNALTLETVKDFVTVGFTANRDSFEFSSFYAYGFPNTVKGEGAIPLTPLGGGDVTLKQRKTVLGIALGYKF